MIDREERVREVFELVWDRAAEERERALNEACADDDALRAQVLGLLQAHAEAGDFLETPPFLTGSPDDYFAPTPDFTGRRIGPYELQYEIGRGGMSSVYLGSRVDDEYRRQVAVKLVWPGPDTEEVIRRFKQERQILADLDHPNIARLLDGGTTEDGWPYIVMEYIEGQPITAYCDERRLSINERLKLFQTVCDAVEYAHRNLVIHRDLKPGNILVTEEGVVKLLDFGVAKLLTPESGAEPRALTRTGLHWMTLEYASPEQMREDPITAASDVYSLGALLYELLTGERPFDLADRPLHEVMRTVCNDDPQPPSGRAGRIETKAGSETVKLRRRLRGDLDNIVLTALRKEAHRRYATVEQFSEDITRHLSGQPVKARGDGLGYRAGKFVRRNKTGTAIAATIFIALVATAVFAWRQAREQRRARYAREMQQELESWAENDIAGVNERLERYIPTGREEDLRGFEWRYLWRLGHRELAVLRHDEQADYYFKGFASQWILTMADGGWHYIWDQETLQRIAKLKMPLSYVDRRLMQAAGVTDGHTVKIVDLPAGNVRRSFSDPSTRIAIARLFDDMERAVTGHDDGAVKFWDVAAGRVVDTLQGRLGRVTTLYFNIDRSRMLVGIDHRVLQLWDVGGKRVLRTFEFEYDLERRLGLSYGHGLFWLNTLDDTVKFYDIATGRNVATLIDPGNRINFAEARGQFLVICGEDKTTKLYEMPGLRRIATFTGHTEGVTYVDIAPDGKIMVTASHDRTIRFWEIATQRERAVIKGHVGEIYNVRFFLDGRRLISSGDDGAVKIWDVDAALEPESLIGHTGRVYSVAFSPDGRMIATASQDRTIKLWDAQTGKALKTFEGSGGQVLCVAFAPDGRRLVSSGEVTAAFVWDVSTGQVLNRLTGHGAQIHSVTFSPDGRLIATGCDDGYIRLWDAVTGQLLRAIRGHGNTVWSVAFSPDSRTLASGGLDRTVKLWDVATGRDVATLTNHTGAIWSVAFSRDGQRLLTAGADQTAKLWDVKSRREIRAFTGHSNEIFEAAFSPDGKRIATASNDHSVRLWNAETGQELLRLNDHTDQVWSVAFSPDGRTLASGGWDRTVRLRRAAAEGEAPSSQYRER